jgi:hypothetical protein
MPVVDVRNIPTVVEFAPENKVVEFTEEAVTAEVVVGPTVVEFSWGELIPEPGLSGGGVFEGRVYIRPDIPTLPTNSEPVDPAADYIMLWDASSDTHVKVLAALGGGGGADIEFATREETDAGVITDKALNPDVGAYAYDRFRWPGQHAAGKGTEVFVVPLASGAFTIDCHESNVFEIVLTQNASIPSPINPIKGQTINVLIKQDAVGSRTVTWGGAWTFFNGIPTLSTEAYAADMLSCQWDDNALKWRCSFLTGFTAGVVGTGVPYALANIGIGAEVYKQTVDELGTDVAQLRSITGGTGITVTQNADEVSIATSLRVFVQSTAPSNPQVNDLWFW